MYAFVGHGYRYSNMVFGYAFLRYVPEFLMGLYIANRRSGLFPVVGTILLMCAFTGALSLAFNIEYYTETGGSALRDRKEILKYTQGTGETREMDAMGIIGVGAAAARAYLFAICFGYFLAIKRFLKPFVSFVFTGLLSVMLISTILSGLTVPLALCGIAILGYAILRVRRISSVIISIAMAGAFGVGTFASYKFNLTVFTQYFDKAWNIVTRLTGTGGYVEEINRYRLFMLSWDTFVSNPIFGVGGRTGIHGVGGVMIGGHSGLADTLGQFGLIGSLGFIILFIYAIRTLYKVTKSEKGNPMGSFYFTFLVFFGMFFIHSFVNPTLGTYSITQVLLLVFGLMMGLVRNKKPFTAIMPPPKYVNPVHLRGR